MPLPEEPACAERALVMRREPARGLQGSLQAILIAWQGSRRSITMFCIAPPLFSTCATFCKALSETKPFVDSRQCFVA